MPKNKGKGGKNRRRGKNENDFMKRELDMKDVGQEYGQVIRMLGNGRVAVHCFDGKERICHIRGKLRKKVWINQGDIILVGLRDYQDDKGDVILKYTADEARRLKQEGQIPENAKLNEKDEQDEGEIEFSDTVGLNHAAESEEDNVPPSGSESEEDSDEEEEEESSEESSEEEDLDEEALAAGRADRDARGRGANRFGKNKYGKRK
ncbi:hypothetical protein WR25_19849 [Diploscapter pachys]|uniref:Eukaryotic translation initiation factor 4C n=1 Tax=Diploscapter pachys TaxID=2018661 RepID=A0A2A2JMX1_9BILA|nr:hypothetical protein WR25_19849 [Diploscapter pachys]